MWWRNSDNNIVTVSSPRERIGSTQHYVLSRFDRIPEREGQTDSQTDRRTDRIDQYRASDSSVLTREKNRLKWGMACSTVKSGLAKMTRRYRLLGRHVVPDRFLSCLRRILLQCSTILQGLLSTPPPTSRATFCNFTSHFDNHVNCSITWQSCHSDSKLSQRATKSESSVCDSHICGDSSSCCSRCAK